jgi:aldehyde dehydrogenase (NAD+)
MTAGRPPSGRAARPPRYRDTRKDPTVTTHAQADTRPAFLDGTSKRLLIDGRWVAAASGKTFDTVDPSTGQVLASVAAGDREDVDRAVATARRAFEGPWSKLKPYDRQQIILKLADLVDRHFDELTLIDTLDMGAPISRTRASRRRLLGLLHFYAGMATALHGNTEVVPDGRTVWRLE